jgi:hypothetical protein
LVVSDGEFRLPQPSAAKGSRIGRVIFEKVQNDMFNRALEFLSSIRQGEFRSQLNWILAHFDRQVKSDFSCALSVLAGAIT